MEEGEKMEYVLDRKSVTTHIPAKKLGTYQLGEIDDQQNIIWSYAGRSTTCVQRRLLKHASKKKYKLFRVQYWNSVEETFDHECLMFHLYRDIITNKKHPDAPRGLPYACKYCHEHHPLQLRTIAKMKGVSF